MTPSEKVIETGLDLLKTATTIAANETPKLLQEYLNYMVFSACLDVLKLFIFASVPYVIFVAFGRIISYEKQVIKEIKDSGCDGVGTKDHRDLNRKREARDRISTSINIRWVLCIGTILALAYTSSNTLDRIGKIIISPKVFLLEEGAKIVKKAPSSEK